MLHRENIYLRAIFKEPSKWRACNVSLAQTAGLSRTIPVNVDTRGVSFSSPTGAM